MAVNPTQDFWPLRSRFESKIRLKQAPALQQAICCLSFSGCNSQHVTGASPYDKPFPCDMVSPSCPPWEIAAIKAFSATDPDMTWQDRTILSECCFAPEWRVGVKKPKPTQANSPYSRTSSCLSLLGHAKRCRITTKASRFGGRLEEQTSGFAVKNDLLIS